MQDISLFGVLGPVVSLFHLNLFFFFFVLQVNRDLISNEMQKMRQQLMNLQAELCARGGGAQSDEVQVLVLYIIEMLFDCIS